MTEKELMGPTGFWLETLRKDEQPKREYLTLADAVAQLNCKLDDLLNEGVAKRLDLYAPVLREGLYAWPVTDRGIPHASLVGSIAGVEPVFRSVLRYGEYAVLLPADIKKIKIEQSVKPGGYICPELVLRHTTEWQQERQQAAPIIDTAKTKSAIELVALASARHRVLARLSWPLTLRAGRFIDLANVTSKGTAFPDAADVGRQPASDLFPLPSNAGRGGVTELSYSDVIIRIFQSCVLDGLLTRAVRRFA